MKIRFHADQQDPAKQHRQTRAFRSLLMAFGYPARIHQLEMDALQAIIKGLLDASTTASFTPECQHLRRSILASGAQLSEQPAWLFAGPALQNLTQIPAGSREAPETGATLVMAIDQLDESPQPEALCIQAQGAGLPSPRRLYVKGLQSGVIRDHIAWRAVYPRGVDLLLCADQQVAALPRHLTLEIL